MERVATARLIEAAATLDPASRALLNIWLHRDLPDAALARMAGLEPAAVTTRKLDIIEHLSEQLGLPPYEIVAALRVITLEPAHEQAAAPPPPGPPAPSPRRRPARARADPPLPPLPAVRLRRGRSALGHLTGTTRIESRARRRALEFVVPVVIVAAILLVTLLPQGGGADGRGVPSGARRPGLPARAGAGRHVAAPRPRRAHRPTVVVSPPMSLASIAGGHPGARGRIELISQGSRKELRVAVSGLHAAHRGRYVAWLYTTVIDSTSLGPLPAKGFMTVRVPRGARRFRWIDISFQPAGDMLNSGESVLRAANPLRHAQAAERRRG